MPDLSADRPLLLPDAFTEEDVALVGDAIGSRSIARIALRVLSAAGRLLPPDAEHREQFGVMGDDPIREKVTGMPKASREAAEEEIADHLADLAPGEVDRWNLRLGHRWLTSWVEVEGSTTDV